jgi:hypothetical protein
MARFDGVHRQGHPVLIRRALAFLVLTGATAVIATVAVAEPAQAGPQDDPPPVAITGGSGSFYDEGPSSAWVAIDAGGSSSGVLEHGQEQAVINEAAKAAGLSDTISFSGSAEGDTASGSADGAEGAGTGPVFTECSWRAADVPAGAAEWQGNDPSTGRLMVNPCNGAGTFVFVPNEALGVAPAAPLPPPDPAVLAQQAYAELVPPSPTAHRSPREDVPGPSGVPFTVVNLWTYFWVDRTDWVPLTRSVELRGVTATVTATPVVMTFDPGNGDDVVRCDGPGSPWVDPGDNTDPDPATVGGCGHRYARVSDGVRATTSIRYAVTWTSNTGLGGTLPDLAGTWVSAPFRVEQIQVVVGAS